ncbi:mobilization protein MbpA, partial [Bacteroides fragilis]|uniref:mobilization protein MbpA n=7 Tax=Bacteroidia TaxID=200643 RepID=UPI0032EF91B5
GNSTLRSRQGLRKFGSEKILSSFAVRFFPSEPLTALRVPLLEWQGKGKRSGCGCAVWAWVYSYAACLHSKKCPCRTFLAFLALLKRIFLPILAGMEVKRTEKITFRCTVLEKAALAEQALRCGLTTSEYCRSLSLGGQPKERYSEEEKALLRDIAKIRGDLQRLNNYFGGRQYREVFEENRVIIEKLKKLLR